MDNANATRKFTALDSKTQMKEILNSVYNSLMVKGYNPVNQIVGYILSEDPTYITNYTSIRIFVENIHQSPIYISVTASLTQLWRTSYEIFGWLKELWSRNAKGYSNSIRCQFSCTWQITSKTSNHLCLVANDIANTFFYNRLTIFYNENLVAVFCHTENLLCRKRIL